MKLTLRRIALLPEYTIGKLFIDGVYFCDTLEDRNRDYNKDGDLLDEGETKIHGETAIPYGTYYITLKVQSPRFKSYKQYAFCKGYLPRLLNVPHFEGVLIHIGNTKKDTDGCILVGENKKKGMVLNSAKTFRALYEKLKLAEGRKEKLEIEIV